MPQPRRTRESGYALLFIFLTVAIIAVTLYTAMPRVAFESQRDKEQLLVDRGEQYKRAIQVYFRKFKKYPAKIEDLENTSGQRFLRQRYVDPMTGKDEWRPIHVGPNGVFIDSLTQKNNKKKEDPASVNNFITELKAIGNSADPVDTQVNPGLRRRPSDVPGGGPAGGNISGVDPAAAGNVPPGASTETDNPILDANEANGNTGEMPMEGGDIPNNALTNSNNLPAALATGGRGMNNPSGLPGQVGFPGQNGLPRQSGLPGQPGPNGQVVSGTDVIRNLLTSPRPGGPPPGVFGGNQINDVGFINQPNNPTGVNNGVSGSFPTPTNATDVGATGSMNAGGNSFNTGFNNPANNGNGATNSLAGSTTTNGITTGVAGTGAGGLTVGGGIAGFASKAERPGIKIYNEHTKYNEWEFIYDYAKDKTMGGGQTVPFNQTGNGLGTKTGTSTATDTTNSQGQFGNSANPNGSGVNQTSIPTSGTGMSGGMGSNIPTNTSPPVPQSSPTGP